MSPDRARRRVTIYGSCVSRDSFELFDQSRYRLSTYHARHSLISAFSPADDDLVPRSALESAFQERMVSADVAADVLRRVARSRPDVLLWDLVDERQGVVELPDRAGYLTWSTELQRSGAALPDGARHIRFGDDEHFRLWSGALDRFARFLAEHDLASRTILLVVPWAERTTSGAPTPVSMGVPASEGNELFARYHAAAVERSGARVLSFTAEEAVAADEHKWGPAPFHYTDDFYRLVANRVDDALG